MPTRRKKNKDYTNLIITIASIVVLLLIGLLIYKNISAAHTKKAEEFNKTHFNENVRIYGVTVGKMTINQATKIINSKAKNQATLINDKVVLSHTGKKVISKTRVTKYFKQQFTKYPSNKNWNFENTTLNTAQDKLNTIKNRTVKYTVDGQEYEFKRSEYFTKVTYEDGKFDFGNTKKIEDKLDSINKKVTTFHKKYPFKLPTGKTIKVKNESYGWAINTKHLIPAIEEALAKGKSHLDGKDYIYGLGYSTYGTGYGMSNHGLGHTYIVVSISQQKVWFYKNGKKALVLDDVVTGTATGNTKNIVSNATPTGVWYIEYKESPSVLKGQNDDGSSYSSPVQYWMPFTVSGCGFHDASWRTDWSKTAYLAGGSHGCVNIKPSEIKQVWDVVEQYEPVIVYQ